jgi:hypothetical protein
MKPPDSRHAKKSVTFNYFPGKKMLEYLITAPSSIPQQLRFQCPNPKLSHPKSHTNNLHFNKNLAKIGLSYQKLFNFDRKKSKFPTVGGLKKSIFTVTLFVDRDEINT